MKPLYENRRLGMTMAALLLVVIPAALYLRAASYPFIFDDRLAIVLNPSIHSLGESLRPPMKLPVTGRPAVNFTFALNHAAGGLNPAGYRLVNLALHIAASLLVMAIVTRVLREGVGVAPSLRGRAGVLGFTAALLWAVHPLNSEAVVYVTQRTELMMAVFLLLTMYAAVRAIGCASSAQRRWWIAGAWIACVLGMASKEVMVVAPLLVLLLDRSAFSSSFIGALRRRAWLHGGLMATWLLLAALVFTSTRSGSVGLAHGITVADYLRTQTGVVSWYQWLSVWPLRLSITHEWPIARAWWDIWPSAALQGALVLLTVAALVKRWWIGLAGAWFYLILTPTSSVLPIATEIAAERRMYLPLLAVVVTVVLLVAWLIGKYQRESAARRFAAVLAGAVAAALAIAMCVLTITRVDDYRDERAIWGSAVEAWPTNSYAHMAFGWALVGQGDLETGRAHLAEAVRLRPDNTDAHYMLGRTEAARGRLDAAVWLLSEALRLSPHNADYRQWLVNALLQLGERQSLEPLAHALLAEPQHWGVTESLAWVFAAAPQSSLRNGDLAVRLATQAARQSGSEPRAMQTLAAALAEAGHWDQAAQAARQAIAKYQSEDRTELAEQTRQQLRLYEAGRPHRISLGGASP